MSCCCEFSQTTVNGLHYITPALGGWGSMRTCMLVPEAHVLYIIPPACGRHGSIAAFIHGVKDRLSYLFLKEEDIVSGRYEEHILQAIDELLEVLEKRPKAFIMVVSCMDDLLGTDHAAILKKLHQAHEDVGFTFCHMNPISTDGPLPPGVTLQKGLFNLLDKKEEKTKNMVNLVGAQVKAEKDGELYLLLNQMGVEKTAHISDYDRFDDWQEMAQARLNLMTLSSAKAAVKDMEEQFGIPFVRTTASYDPDVVLDQYRQIAEALGAELPAITEQYYQKAIADLKAGAEYLKNVKIVLSASCTSYPFGLARVLKRYGYNVQEVMMDNVKKDRTNRKKLMEEYPEVMITRSTHYSVVLYEHTDENILALGLQAGYLTGARHIVTISKDEGLFGFHGISRFVELMKEAWETEIDLEKTIEEKGLVV